MPRSHRRSPRSVRAIPLPQVKAHTSMRAAPASAVGVFGPVPSSALRRPVFDHFARSDAISQDSSGRRLY